MLLPFRRSDLSRLTSPTSRKKLRMLSVTSAKRSATSPPNSPRSALPLLPPALESKLENRVLRFRKFATQNPVVAGAMLDFADKVLRGLGA